MSNKAKCTEWIMVNILLEYNRIKTYIVDECWNNMENVECKSTLLYKCDIHRVI